MLLPKHQIKRQHIATYVQGVPDLEGKKAVIKKWKELIEKGRILKRKEESIKDDFIKDIFVTVLGYDDEQSADQKQWHLEKELKTQFDGKKPDASIGYFSTDHNNELIEDVRMVVEIKGPQVNLDKKQNRKDFSGSPVDQAFGYSYRVGSSCKWVMVTNLLELRLYRADDINQYHQFNLSDLGEPHNKLDEFLFYCAYGQLFLEHGASRIETLYGERQKERVTISNEFYSAYHDHRSTLFFTLLKGNPEVPWKQLFASTQKLIDRIIFICFVRDLDLVGNVLKQADESARGSFDQSNSSFWREILHLFDALDKGYRVKNIPPFNGGLFRPDEVINNLRITDEQIEPFVRFASDYDFHSQLDVNILGHIFEQSISDLEELKSYVQGQNPILAGEVKSIDQASLSKRKKDGVYYTPDYITKYMVQEAVGSWLDDRKREILLDMGIDELPEPDIEDYIGIGKEKNKTIETLVSYYQAYEQVLSTIKVLDPACGSGAFLTQVFDYLYGEWKTLREELTNLTTPLQTRLIDELNPFGNGLRDEWKIKKSIVLNNLYGVDLNPESVEITKLSLWLKTANRTESLADLTDNIRQGNSIVSQKKYAGDDAFDWQVSFEPILRQGGFHIVLGNPPYFSLSRNKEWVPYFEKGGYSTYVKSTDIYVLFYELGVQMLAPKGYLYFITSNSWLRSTYGEPLHKYLRANTQPIMLVDIQDKQVFKDATVESCILGLKKDNYHKPLRVTRLRNLEHSESLGAYIKQRSFEYEVPDGKPWVIEDAGVSRLMEKIEKTGAKLGELEVEINRGFLTGFNDAFIIDAATRAKLISKDPNSADIIKPILRGRDISAYSFIDPGLYIIATFPSLHLDIESYPAVKKHLLSFGKRRLEQSGREGSRKKTSHLWFETQDSIAYWQEFDKPKIIWGELSDKPKFTLDTNGYLVLNTVFFLTGEDLPFYLGILNSKLSVWYFHLIGTTTGMGTNRWLKYKIELFPIATASKKDKADFSKQVDSLLALKSEWTNSIKNYLEVLLANYPTELALSGKLKSDLWSIEFIDVITELGKSGVTIPKREQKEWLDLFKEGKDKSATLRSQIVAAETAIDQQVYRIYGLSTQEIKIIEQGVK